MTHLKIRKCDFQDDGQLCFPRKVVALRGADAVRYVVLDKGVDGKTRAQIFNQGGEFVKRINMSKSFIFRKKKIGFK